MGIKVSLIYLSIIFIFFCIQFSSSSVALDVSNSSGPWILLQLRQASYHRQLRSSPQTHDPFGQWCYQAFHPLSPPYLFVCSIRRSFQWVALLMRWPMLRFQLYLVLPMSTRADLLQEWTQLDITPIGLRSLLQLPVKHRFLTMTQLFLHESTLTSIHNNKYHSLDPKTTVGKVMSTAFEYFYLGFDITSLQGKHLLILWLVHLQWFWAKMIFLFPLFIL